jgi:acyl-CoA synthetase (NDP forming)
MSSSFYLRNEKDNKLDYIFHPESVAIIGASESDFSFTQPLLKSKIKEKLFLVNPKRKKIFDVKCYSSILDVEVKVDYAIIAVPAPIVPLVLKECISKGVKVAHIFSSGFSETGIKERIELENEIKEMAKGKIRLLGPNCMGVYCPESGLTFSDEVSFEEGPVALVSQSGTFAVDLLAIGSALNIKFSKVVSYGNAVDLDCPDFLDYFTDDPKTKIVALYIEGTKNGRRLKSSLEKLAKQKPVVALKGGITEHGSRAASSHTGAMAGSPEIWTTLFKQLGVIHVETFNEMIDIILALLYSPLPQGENISIITFSGGFSVIETDWCVKLGLNVPQFTDKTIKKLRNLVPIAGTSVKNPLDAWPLFESEVLPEAVKVVGLDKNIDLLILHLDSRFLKRHWITAAKESFKKFIKNLLASCNYVRDKHRKPIMICNYPPPTLEREATEYYLEVLKVFRKNNYPVYPSIERAAKSIYNLCRYRDMKYKQSSHRCST